MVNGMSSWAAKSTLLLNKKSRQVGRVTSSTYRHGLTSIPRSSPRDYSHTIKLPRSTFPPVHVLDVERSIQQDPKFANSYLEQDHARPPYVIHDGPPFANGPIHLGHAINKILKDIAARYASITGRRAEFVTGWDCHGLPIELQVLKLMEQQRRQSNYGGGMLLECETSPEHFRTKARAFAKTQIDLQMAAFKRLSLFTDWNKRYTTDDPSYVANQLRAFSQLYEQKLIYKDLMPINWSLVNKTTVSEADIDYRDHLSKSAYILYEIINFPLNAEGDRQAPVFALIWTTTPYTLLENYAIAFNRQETYCLIKAWTESRGDTKYILSALDSVHRVQSVLQRLGFSNEIKNFLPGNVLDGLTYKPLLDKEVVKYEPDIGRPRPLLHADFVEASKGTGLVHISANYGAEDFMLIKRNQIPIRPSLVDENGNFTDGAGRSLTGKHIFTDGKQTILDLLDKRCALLLTEFTQHKYPYETRTNSPVMIRASSQVFLDVSPIITKCLKALESVSFFPENRRLQFINCLNQRPDWCISRQRLWGTPIPVFYEADDALRRNMITHPHIIEHLCKLLYKRRFMDYWWTIENQELIPQELLDSCKLPYKSENLVRGEDIFDVWSDSGLSWHTTMDGLNDPNTQCDLYLEGYDQVRGWFSSSSILSMALRNCLPTKRFYFHGFALDKTGRKMSKSVGNVVDPVSLFDRFGVDPVRFWVAREAGCYSEVCTDIEDVQRNAQWINKLRLTLRYLIGSLKDHDTADDQLNHTKLELFDQYFLDKLHRFAATVDGFYKSYRYDQVCKRLVNFINDELSPIYIHTIKDSLYCDPLDSPRRKSILTVLNLTYNILVRSLYPIVPHIVHETGQHMMTTQPLNEWQDLAYKASWKNDILHNQFETMISLRSACRTALGIKVTQLSDQDCVLTINDKKVFKSLAKVASLEMIGDLFNCSTLVLSYNEKLTVPDEAKEVSHELVEEQDYAAKKFASEGLTNVKVSTDPAAAAAAVATDLTSSDLVDHCWRPITTWCLENRSGGEVAMNSGSTMRFEISYRRTNNQKCLRCRRFNVLSIDDHINICDRCKDALLKLETSN